MDANVEAEEGRVVGSSSGAEQLGASFDEVFYSEHASDVRAPFAKTHVLHWLSSRSFFPSGALEEIEESMELRQTYLPFLVFDVVAEGTYAAEVTVEAREVSSGGGGSSSGGRTGASNSSQQVKKLRQRVQNQRLDRISCRFVEIAAEVDSPIIKKLSRSLPTARFLAEKLSGKDADRRDGGLGASFASARGARRTEILRKLPPLLPENRRKLERTILEDRITAVATKEAEETIPKCFPDHKRTESVKVDVQAKIEDTYLLVQPVWICEYRYKGSRYTAIFDVASSEVIGKRPYSWWKIAFAGAATAGSVFLLYKWLTKDRRT